MKDKTIIIIYGAIAVGKLTTAKLLAKQTGMRLSHNHLVTDLVSSVFERGNPERDGITERLRLAFYTEVAKTGVSLVITHTYAHNFASNTGLTDPAYMQELERLFTEYGYTVQFVHLKASAEALLDRVTNEDRSAFFKLTDRTVMAEDMARHDYDTSAPVKNNLVIENTDTPAINVVDEIIRIVNT